MRLINLFPLAGMEALNVTMAQNMITSNLCHCTFTPMSGHLRSMTLADPVFTFALMVVETPFFAHLFRHLSRTFYLFVHLSDAADDRHK